MQIGEAVKEHVFFFWVHPGAALNRSQPLSPTNFENDDLQSPVHISDVK